jgi:hypothetical protein
MTEEHTEPKTITCFVTKHALRTGVIFRVQAYELGTTGSIQVVDTDSDLGGHIYRKDEFETLEFLARQKVQAKLVNAIKYAEFDLERLRKLDFSGPTGPGEEETA